MAYFNRTRIMTKFYQGHISGSTAHSIPDLMPHRCLRLQSYSECLPRLLLPSFNLYLCLKHRVILPCYNTLSRQIGVAVPFGSFNHRQKMGKRRVTLFPYDYYTFVPFQAREFGIMRVHFFLKPQRTLMVKHCLGSPP